MNSHESIVKQKVCDEQLRKNLSSAMHTLQKNRQNLQKTALMSGKICEIKVKMSKTTRFQI